MKTTDSGMPAPDSGEESGLAPPTAAPPVTTEPPDVAPPVATAPPAAIPPVATAPPAAIPPVAATPPAAIPPDAAATPATAPPDMTALSAEAPPVTTGPAAPPVPAVPQAEPGPAPADARATPEGPGATEGHTAEPGRGGGTRACLPAEVPAWDRGAAEEASRSLGIVREGAGGGDCLGVLAFWDPPPESRRILWLRPVPGRPRFRKEPPLPTVTEAPLPPKESEVSPEFPKFSLTPGKSLIERRNLIRLLGGLRPATVPEGTRAGSSPLTKAPGGAGRKPFGQGCGGGALPLSALPPVPGGLSGRGRTCLEGGG